MEKTLHRKEEGEQQTYRVVPATDATGQQVGEHVFRLGDDGPEYVGEGDPVDPDWVPEEELTNDDAPQSAFDAVADSGEH